jgi:nickel/cobalt transporter (NiCoT) family protein
MSYRYVAIPLAAGGPEGSLRRHLRFTRSEWRRLAGLYGAVALLHLVGGGLYFHYLSLYPVLAGLGFVAYMFGLRHAFDADHIAAVDDTIRYMLQQGQRPLGVGFFFSLGHSTVVIGLAIAVIFATGFIGRALPALKNIGGLFGTGISGAFLLLIGLLNFLVLLDIFKAWGKAGSARHGHDHLEALLAQRGFMNRLFGARLRRIVTHSWQMYPLGLLFGLGFDTASEVGLLAMTAGASVTDMPVLALLSLPLLFAAGMTAMDTTDGVLMSKVYDWAFVNPLRKIFYNVTITSLSIVVAVVIGGIELLQVSIAMLDLRGLFFDFVGSLDFGLLGYLVVGLFVAAWAASLLIWKFGRIEERYGHLSNAHAHEHAHENGVRHVHKHFHEHLRRRR